MAKQLRCSALHPECDFMAWAETEEELKDMVALHAESAHGIDEMTPELEKKVEAAMEDV